MERTTGSENVPPARREVRFPVVEGLGWERAKREEEEEEKRAEGGGRGGADISLEEEGRKEAKTKEEGGRGSALQPYAGFYRCSEQDPTHLMSCVFENGWVVATKRSLWWWFGGKERTGR